MGRRTTWGALAAGVLLAPSAALGAVPATATTAGTEPVVPGALELGGARAEVSTDTREPTVLTAGLWADTLTGPGSAPGNAHQFRYERTVRDSTVHVGVVATSPEDSGDAVQVVVRTPEGDVCGDDSSSSGYPATSSAFGARLVVPDGEAGDRDDPCLQAATLEITLSRGSSSYDGDLPVAIRLVEEAPLDSFGDLPPVPEDPPLDIPTPTGEATPVEGGASFDSAPTLTSEVGRVTVSDALTEGTERLYRVRLGWGQALAVRVDVPSADEATVESFDADSPDLDLTLFDPLRNSFDGGVENGDTSGSWGTEPLRLASATGPVSYLYRFDDVVMSVPGDYWVSLASAAPANRSALDVPVEITVEVVGEPGPSPSYAAGVLAPQGGPGPDDYDPARPFLLGVDEYAADVSGEPPLPPGPGGDAAEPGRGGTRTVAGAVVGAAGLVSLLAGVVLLRRRRLTA